MNKPAQLWRLMRPRQWVKSCFVLTGVLFSNAWRQPQVAQRVLLAATAFSLAASGVYIINDLLAESSAQKTSAAGRGNGFHQRGSLALDRSVAGGICARLAGFSQSGGDPSNLRSCQYCLLAAP